MILSHRKKCLSGLGKLLLDAGIHSGTSVQMTLSTFVYNLSVTVVMFQVSPQSLLAGDRFYLQKAVPTHKDSVKKCQMINFSWKEMTHHKLKKINKKE